MKAKQNLQLLQFLHNRMASHRISAIRIDMFWMFGFVIDGLKEANNNLGSKKFGITTLDFSFSGHVKCVIWTNRTQYERQVQKIIQAALEIISSAKFGCIHQTKSSTYCMCAGLLMVVISRRIADVRTFWGSSRMLERSILFTFYE